MNRKDLYIAIVGNLVFVAQGNPAYEQIDDDAIIEGPLYYSQLRHRIAYRDADGSVGIVRPSLLPKTAVATVDCFPGRVKCTGTPSLVGTL